VTGVSRAQARLAGLPRRRLLRAVVVFTVMAVVGFLLVGAAGHKQAPAVRLSSQDEGALSRILGSLTGEADSLRDEVANLKLQLQALQNAGERDQAAQAAAAKQLRDLQVLAGTVPVTGPGITVAVTDARGKVTYDLLIDLVEELRDAGAEALAVDSHRLAATSWFAQSGTTLVVDGTAIGRPGFKVSAIGQPATLDGGVAIPGGALDTLRAQQGVQVTVTRSASLVLPATAR
jgi:uncharacterized protein YlxW (UPF0749 family)